MNAAKIAAALRAQAEALKLLADALETDAPTGVQPTNVAPDALKTDAPTGVQPTNVAPATAPAPQKRGRGRPAAGEAPAAPAASPEPAAAPTPAPSPESDPFAPAAPAAPTVTQDQVRGALTALRTATDQATALKVLADHGGGATTLVGEGTTVLKTEFYDAVFKAAANAAAAKSAPAAAPAESDPFGPAPTAAAAQPAAAPSLTIDAVKALTTKTVARTTADTVQRVLMQHGGKATNPDTGIEGPSLKALPAENYAKYVAALEALPSVK